MALNMQEIDKLTKEYDKYADDNYIVSRKKNTESAGYCENMNVVLNRHILQTLIEIKNLLSKEEKKVEEPKKK